MAEASRVDGEYSTAQNEKTVGRIRLTVFS
jgi:hypothetical protein